MCGHACAKYTLIVFNVIFWIAGAALLGISIWSLVDKDNSVLLDVLAIGDSQQLLRAASITLCVVGGVIFIMGVIGCCGALKESACLLNTYATVVIILLLVQVAAGVLAVVFKDRILKDLENSMLETVTTRYNVDGYDTQTEALDFLQTQFECCGVKQPYLEWQASEWNKTSTLVVPLTCCVLQNKKAVSPTAENITACQLEAMTGNNSSSVYFHNTGCYDSMNNWVRSHSAILMGVAFGLAGLQIMMVVFACCVACEVRNKNVVA